MLKPNEFKIYNASAGAGKTYTLVKEYLSILLSHPSPSAFESILAITFTNKAANEMKERILSQLIRFSQENFPENKELEKWADELQLSPETVHLRSKLILKQILHNYSRFSVSTIDKFNLRLMKSFAQDLGLSSNFNVEMELNKLLEESVDQLFSKIGDDELLTSVLIEIALDNLNENRTWDITRELISNAKSLYSDTHIEKIAQLQKYDLKEFNQFRKTVYQNVSRKKNQLKENAKNFFSLIQENHLQADEFSGGRNGIPGFFSKFLNEKFELPTDTHKKNIQNTDLKKFASAKALPSAFSAIEQIFPEIKNLFYESVDILSDLPVWEGVQKTIASMSILNEVEKAVETIKEDNNVLLISEFNKLISSNLQKQPSGFIYERIGNRFHHYFIDEFQDTSTLQWQNLLPLVENARAGSDTVMLVGDAKQSIYRWRGGNPEQMIGLINESESLNINVENLPKNWRSYDKIIEFNNDFYSKISESLKIENYKTLYESGNRQEINDKKGGYVQLNYLLKSDGNEQYQSDTLEQVVKNIDSIIGQGFEFNEITILHRTKAQGKMIAEFLSEKGIPILSAESLLLINSPEIQLIELFLKTISNEEDYVSKAQFLLKLNQIKNFDNQDITAEIQTVVKKDLKALKEFLFAHQIDIDFVNKPSISLYDFTEKTIEILGFGKNGSSYLQYFLDYVLEHSTQNEYSLTRFLEDWDLQKETLSISSPEGVNAINLMTIHKSKGLEFPVVILPFADWGDRMMPSQFWIPVKNEELPFDEFIVNGFGNLEEVSDEIKEIIQKERNEFLFDNLNMLYVATTRAVEQLYIITEKTNKEGTGMATYFNQQFQGENELALKGEKNRISIPKMKELVTEEIPFEFEEWESRLEISRESSKRWKKKKEIVYGDLVHGLMKFVLTEKDIEPTLKSALISGEITQEELPELKNKILEIVQHPELKTYYSDDKKVLNERDFVNDLGEVFRPDRIVLDGNNCTIIDYKTGEEKPKDIFQVELYAENLKKLGYTISGIFIIYIGNSIHIKSL